MVLRENAGAVRPECCHGGDHQRAAAAEARAGEARTARDGVQAELEAALETQHAETRRVTKALDGKQSELAAHAQLAKAILASSNAA